MDPISFSETREKYADWCGKQTARKSRSLIYTVEVLRQSARADLAPNFRLLTTKSAWSYFDNKVFQSFIG